MFTNGKNIKSPSCGLSLVIWYPLTPVVPDSPVGTGGGRGELTETQLDKLLASGVGAGKTSSDSGAGSGLSATETATNAGSGDAPQSTNDATGVSNDGAPCK